MTQMLRTRSSRAMSRIMIAASLAHALVASVAAQWTSDAAVNTQVASGGGDQSVPIVRTAIDGGVWVFFYDNGAGGGYRPVMQRLTAGGVRAFAGNGVVLANRTNTAIFTSDADVDALGNAYAVFDDNGGQVTVQKIEPNGNLPWGAGGIQVPTLAGSLGNRIATCADGTIVVAGAVSNVLQFQRLNADGSFVAGEAWSLAETGRAQLASDLISGGSGGDVILLWVRAEGTNAVTSRKGLKIQKWNATHVPQWSGAGGPGSAIDVYTSSTTRQIQNGYFPAALPDGSGGAVIAWYDNGSARNAWLQHVLALGTQRFAQDGLAVSTTPGTTELRLSASGAYLPAADEYVVAYERSNATQSQYGLGAQRITAAGGLLWGAAGQGLSLIPIDSANHKSFVQVQPAPGGGAVVA